jgi:predicted Abi (CAAX) family protease
MVLIEPSDYFYKQNTHSSLYLPIGDWTGRLLLPSQEQRQTSDSVLFEVHNAPQAYQDLIGKTVNLSWSSAPEVQAVVAFVTRDVTFTEEAAKAKKRNLVVPERLNGWKNVGPLESLAGARPEDDMIVMLPNPVTVNVSSDQNRSLIIEQQPIQITGSIYALVTIIEREGSSDRFVVRHFNKNSQQFDGASETIRIPQAQPDDRGVPRSTNQDIEKSPLNATGWYIYGVKTADGTFVTQAISPRALLQLQPNEVRLGLDATINYIDQENWLNTEAQKGTGKTVLLDPTATEIPDAISKYQEGDQVVLIHTFGGIGGKKGEFVFPPGFISGHFAYGIGRVVREPLSEELHFDIVYRQVYAHNPDAIISGAIHWSSFLGDLQRGRLGDRPICDELVQFPPVTKDYDFDGIKLSPMAEFTRQLDIMTARYRIGDGDGASMVTPASSCVQDSNQALFLTFEKMEKEVASHSQIQDWLHRHPNDSQTQGFQQLVQLRQELERNLVPLGIVRSDWRQNQTKIVGAGTNNLIIALIKGFFSWRTMIPRRAQDEISKIWLKNGANMWVLRTNQIGGFNPDITPLAPTALFGRWTK